MLAQTGGGMTLSQPTWLDRKGTELGIAGKLDPDVYSDPFLSRDGRLLAYSRTDSGSLNTDVGTANTSSTRAASSCGR